MGQGILSRLGWRFQQQSWKWYMHLPGQRQCHTNRKARNLFECNKERTPFFWTSSSIMANQRWCYRCLALTSFDMFRVFGGQVLLPVVYGSRCADEQLSNWAEHLSYERAWKPWWNCWRWCLDSTPEYYWKFLQCMDFCKMQIELLTHETRHLTQTVGGITIEWVLCSGVAADKCKATDTKLPTKCIAYGTAIRIATWW